MEVAFLNPFLISRIKWYVMGRNRRAVMMFE